MADETTLSGDVKDKGRVDGAEERGERDSDLQPGETSRDTEPKETPLFSVYLRRSSSGSSSTTDSLSSSQRSDLGVDCAGIVLNCLFCRFGDMILMLRGSCEMLSSRCCPDYEQVVTTRESAPSGAEDWDCGLFTSCQDAGDCLELAMEMSELCYH